MTKEDVAVLIGEKTEDTDYVVDIILKQIKPGFVKSAIKAELKETEAAINALKDEGFISVKNGIYQAFWRPGINSGKYMEANRLIYTRNRLIHFLYHN